ncbi:MAG: phenylacetate--CoA ligase family protein [Vicinamibacterales bacterium]
MTTGGAHPDEVARLDREVLWTHQWSRALELFERIYGRSAFYTAKLNEAGYRVGQPWRRRADLQRIPLTSKAELVADQALHAPWGSVISEPLTAYTRYNQTSGTTGRPMRWIDTPESWQWSVDCWKAVYAAARVTGRDRVFFAFSFGPFYGFWTAFDAAVSLGAHAVPGGGLSSAQRLALIEAVRPTVVCCTPTYALRLAEVAAAEHPPGWLAGLGVRVLIVAGEPGGSIPATRERIASAWNARVIDHHGLTEVGPVSFECWEAPGFLHLNEEEFLCEVLDPETHRPVPEGQPGELVITNLRRFACPAIRYRTGDLVALDVSPCPCGRTAARLAGGIRARVDDMVTVRGVNVYPTAVEAIVRRFADVAEFRTVVSMEGPLRTLAVEIEPVPAAVPDGATLAARVASALHEGLGLSVAVAPAAEPLPRFEMKARRFVFAVEPTS